MAVLIEAISVVVRRDAINNKFSGGWSAFQELVPNATLCFDDDLACVGFMAPPDVGEFIKQLEKGGLTFLREEDALDLAVVDQIRGPTTKANWLQFAQVPLKGIDKKVAACWLYEGQGMGAGIHFPSTNMTLATPIGWRYEESLSAHHTFVANEDMKEKLEFLRRERNVDVYVDRSTGKEVFIGRTDEPVKDLPNEDGNLKSVNSGDTERGEVREFGRTERQIPLVVPNTGTVVKRLQLTREVSAGVIKDPESLGPMITYRFVMVVTKKDKVLGFVTAERFPLGEMMAKEFAEDEGLKESNVGGPMLCSYFGGIHGNHGSSPQYQEVNGFIRGALEVLAKTIPEEYSGGSLDTADLSDNDRPMPKKNAAKVFSARGRATRLQFAFGCLGLSVVAGLWVLIVFVLGFRSNHWPLEVKIFATVVAVVVGLGLILASYFLIVRRLHDINLSGNWIVIPLFFHFFGYLGMLVFNSPVAGAVGGTVSLLFSLMLLLYPGTPGLNQYDADFKKVGESINVKPQKPSQTSAENETIEVRLKHLAELKEKGLISQTVLEEKQKQILNAL